MNLYSKLKDMAGWPQAMLTMGRPGYHDTNMCHAYNQARIDFQLFLQKVEADDLEIMTIMKNEVLRIAKTGKHFKWQDLAQVITKGLKYKLRGV